jgi:hypothetical protein
MTKFWEPVTILRRAIVTLYYHAIPCTCMAWLQLKFLSSRLELKSRSDSRDRLQIPGRSKKTFSRNEEREHNVSVKVVYPCFNLEYTFMAWTTLPYFIFAHHSYFLSGLSDLIHETHSRIQFIRPQTQTQSKRN